MAYPPAPPQILKVRYKLWFPVLCTVVGGVLALVGLLNLMVGNFTVGIVTGPVLLLVGVPSFVNPYLSYEPATGGLYMHSPLGYRAATYGAPKGERLWFDGTNLLRIKADGTQKRVNVKLSRPEEIAPVLQAVTAAQQQAR
ncbi:hypothetical protein SAMN05216298_0544 [Glycomyces sambucus]|uniref:Uncharacterized protein n=1 Tax=Glycomyces sambucus TaxID=380244 RepID=A0A1G9CWD9_9ACTN|nr:hypothetical protein [Glycomyces sambucus]SDK55980.1 hypothetical protein SAMN05216298_0544 [Glycomyces sambucus]